jgi:hypothetical protein
MQNGAEKATEKLQWAKNQGALRFSLRRCIIA